MPKRSAKRQRMLPAYRCRQEGTGPGRRPLDRRAENSPGDAQQRFAAADL